jgi:hypothetical protein
MSYPPRHSGPHAQRRCASGWQHRAAAAGAALGQSIIHHSGQTALPIVWCFVVTELSLGCRRRRQPARGAGVHGARKCARSPGAEGTAAGWVGGGVTRPVASSPSARGQSGGSSDVGLPARGEGAGAGWALGARHTSQRLPMHVCCRCMLVM